MELDKQEQIEIRSEEVQEILGKPPRKIIRYGIGVMLSVIIVLFIGMWFFKYPEIIEAQVTLTTSNPPANLKAMSTGKITKLYFDENAEIKQNDVVAIIENTANFKDITLLESIIDTLLNPWDLPDDLQLELGEMQSVYSSFMRLLFDYHNFEALNYHASKIEAIKQQQNDYSLYFSRLKAQERIKQKELGYAKKQFARDSALFEEGINCEMEYEKASVRYLQEKSSYENLKASMINTRMQINQLEKQILDLELQHQQENTRYINQISEAFLNLKSQLKKWKQTYVIASPIDGNITYTKIWSANQNVNIGEVVATIIPSLQTDIIGKLVVPTAGAGKVKKGQRVNIKLDNFPYMEYGMIRSRVENISQVPVMTEDGAFYIAEAEISDSLISNYGLALDFSQEMTGTAEIITEDIRLLQRLFNPLKALLNKQKGL